MDRRVAAIREARTAIRSREMAGENLARLTAQASFAGAEVPFLAALLPEEDTLVDFPREAAALARQYALDFSFAFGASEKGTAKAPGHVAFSMSGKGGTDGWFSFLRAFEAGSKIVRFEDIRMESGDGAAYDVTSYGKIFTQ